MKRITVVKLTIEYREANDEGQVKSREVEEAVAFEAAIPQEVSTWIDSLPRIKPR